MPVSRSLGRRLLLLALVIAMIGVSNVPASGQGAGYVEPANMNELIVAAAKEGTLTLAAGAVYGGAPGAQIIQDHINKKYHVNLNIHYVEISVGQAFQIQLGQEVRAGQTTSSDIAFSLFGAPLAPYMQRIDWRKYVPEVPESDMFYDKRSVGAYTSLEAVDYNTSLVPRNQIPQSFADLLKPQWKGKIATSPYQSNFLAYIGLPEVFGHRGMLDFVNKFSAQLSGIMVCGQVDRVSSGEFAMFGLDCGDYEVRKRVRKNQPIASMYPKEGTALTYVAPAIPLTAAHPNAARLFIAFLLTREGQEVLWDVSAADNHQMSGSHMSKLVADLKKRGIKIVEVYGLDVKHPELVTYAREIDKVINQGK